MGRWGRGVCAGCGRVGRAMLIITRVTAAGRRVPAPLAEAAALATLALPLLLPLLTAGLPETDDGLFHYYRSIVMAWHLQHGDLFPRLSADLGYGYGLPVFNFYAPLFYYPAALLILLGVAPALAVNLTAAVAAVLGAWGALRLGRAWLGETAGWAAAAAQMAAPYWLLDLYRRGALPELLGLALLPWGMLACYSLARQGTRRAWWAAAIATALAMLAHNIGALWSLPAFVAAIGAGVLMGDGERRLKKGAARAGLALLVGLGLAAFFLVPAVVESQWVQTTRLTVPRHLDYRNNFLAPVELAATPQAFDPTQINPRVPRSLGLPQLALAALGAMWVWVKPARTRWLWLAVALGTGACAALTVSASRPIWEALVPLKFIQFPWRWLGPASLGLALLAGFGAQEGLARLGGWQRPGFALVAAGLLAGNLTWAFGTHHAQPMAAGIEAVRQYERESGHIGLSTEGEFLPIWVSEAPAPDALSDHVGEGNLLARIDPLALPAGIRLIGSEARLTQTTATFMAEAPGQVVFDWFYFPGWRASVNGQPAAIQIQHPSGRIGVEVPAGESEVRLTYGTTPARTAGLVVSVLAALAVIAGGRRLAPEPAPSSKWPADARGLAAASLVVGAGLALWRVGWVDTGRTPWMQPRYADGSVRGMSQALDATFDDQLALLGWDAPAHATPSGESAALALYWRALQPLAEDYSIAVQLVDAAGLLVTQNDSQHPAQYPTSAWRVEHYARDEHRLTLPAGLPPGEYRLLIGVYREADGASLAPASDSLARSGQLVEIGQISVERARQAPPVSALGLETLPMARFGAIQLIGGTVAPASARPGDELVVTSYWEAMETPDAAYRAEYALTDAAGAQFDFSLPPATPGYPTSQWTAGEILRGTHRVRVPPEAAPGAAELTVTVLDETGQALGARVALGQVEIQPVTRSFVRPGVAVPNGAMFGGAIALSGTSAVPSEVGAGTERVELVLYWQAREVVEQPYTVFVHLLDSAGNLAAQVDAAPLGGARPTTSWLPGEYLSDPYTLLVPTGLAPATYRLEVGLYRADTGERLPVTSNAAAPGATSLLIGTVTVNE